jgi:hypothetical protein
MNRQKIGQILFWFGVANVFVMQALTWFQSPMQRVHTAEELSGTAYAVDGALWWIRMVAASGLTFSIMGVLLYTGKKGSFFWLLGFLPGTVISVGMFWQPAQYVPQLFGIGGAIILLSYFGILWLWTRTYTAYEGLARTGKQIQLLGYSFLVSTGFLLCLYFGNPNLPALAEYPIPAGLSINITLSLGMLLLFVGHYLVAQKAK